MAKIDLQNTSRLLRSSDPGVLRSGALNSSGFQLLPVSGIFGEGNLNGLSGMLMRQSGTNTKLPDWVILIACALFLYFPVKTLGAEGIISNAPTARATNGVTGFRIRQGFRVEQVAGESVVSAPAAMAFDENGRLFVAEMRDYPERREQSPHLGRIRLLEDTDGDGVFDSSTVFADDIALPSAIACYNGGIFVGATPEILYFKDVDGDGIADERRTVFSGFGGNSRVLRFDFLLNNFAWGLDNRIHGGASGIGGTINAVEAKGSEPIMLGRNDFSFDPRVLTLSAEAGSAQSGLTFDDRGRKFFCDFTHSLRQAMFEPRYFARNPFFASAPEAVDSAQSAAPIYRLVAPNSGPAVPSGATRQATAVSAIPYPAWFTRARGCAVYRGNAFPTNFIGNAFVADAEAHCIHRMWLRENGLEVVAERPPGEQNTEFLQSTDTSFHPVQIVNGPDGVLYIADFRDGGESGRILRIVPDNFKQPKPPQLGKAKTYDLAATLAHADGWHRDTAARLLCEKRDPAAIGLLTNMVNNARIPVARLHALATLDAAGGLNEAVVLKGLRDAEPPVRERAVLLCENLAVNGNVSDTIWNQLRLMSNDLSPSVRYQLALTLGEIRHQGRPQLLAQMLGRGGNDLYMQTAIFSSLGEGAGECFAALAEDGATRNSAAGLDLLRRLAMMIGTQGELDEVDQVIDWLERNEADPRLANIYVVAAGLGEGLRRTGSSLSLVDPKHRLERVYSQAVGMSADYKVADPLRLEAIRLVGAGAYSVTDVGDWFLLLLEANQSPAIQWAAIKTLGGYSDPRIVTSLLARWPGLNPTLKKQVVAALLSRVDRLDMVLAAIESGRIQPEEVNTTDVNMLRAYGDSSIRQRAVRLFGPLSPQRPAVVEGFRSALRLAGDVNHGRELYQARCANCHGMEEHGRTLGPDLADMRALSKDKLLSSIIQPNAQMQSKYITCVIETKNGRLSTGLLEQQNSRAVTLIAPNSDEVVLPRSNVESIEPQPWTLMPEGLEQGLDTKAMADILEYILAPAGGR